VKHTVAIEPSVSE